MEMLLDSQWVDREDTIAVQDPFDESIIDHVPNATKEDVLHAIAAAVVKWAMSSLL